MSTEPSIPAVEASVVETTITQQSSDIVQTLPDGNVLVVACEPSELKQAQAAMLTWFQQKLKSLATQLSEAQSNLALAIKSKWKRAPFQKIVRDLNNDIIYYEKAASAVAAGYCIVPEFPVSVLAIRTAYEGSGAERLTTGWKPVPIDEPDKNLPIGEGAYVDPEVPMQRSWTSDQDRKEGKQRWTADEHYNAPSIPVRFMKPRVLEAAQRAMAEKIFDDIGVLPRRKKRDPILVGRIHGPKGKLMTFMLSWFVDTRDL